MSTATIGGINVTISATIDKFVKPVNQARALSKTFVKDLSGMTKAVLGFSGAISAGALVASLKSTINHIDSLGKSADRLGISAQSVRILEVAADEAEISFSSLAAAVQKSGIAMQAALGGDKSKQGAFSSIGLSVKELASLNAVDRLSAIGLAIDKLGTQSQKAAAAQAIFGKSGITMLGIFKDGNAILSEARERIGKFGGVLTDGGVKSAQAFNDSIDDLKTSWEGLMISLADTGAIAALATAINGLASATVSIVNSFKAWVYSFKELYRFAQMLGDMFGGGLPKAVPITQNTVPTIVRTATSGVVAPRTAAAPSGAPAFAGRGVASGTRSKATPYGLALQAGGGVGFNLGLGTLASMNAVDRLKNFPWAAGWGNLKEFGRDSMRAFGHLNPFGWESKKAKAPKTTAMTYRGISAADPLSREGFAQRVRSIGQGSAGNIAQKQLKVQERTANAVEKMAKNPPVVLKAANL